MDEKENPTNLKFYWRGMAYDTHFDLQDRLQQLYQQGMELSLNEKVTYINDKTIEDAFVFFKDDPDATKETIKRYFNQLKYFTNNDFALIDVHNEKLFYQNAVILLSIVQMLQDIRLKSDSEEHSNQFLGDMFEGFLDAGVKQSEGQFFTPMPIVKFIMASLPLEQLIAESEQPPKAIDYACGAGHFLTELARQLKPLVEKYKKAEIKDYYSQITGLEKEYRLSKVAKVSAFMYGQDEINIIYTDALSRNAGLQDGTFNLLVANPPYSVKGFLETLTMPDKKSFELYGVIDSKSVVNNNAIETFFIERAKQLLAPDGVAAIILPSSILSNDARLYQAAREVLLKNFHIIAIAELGSCTFGKTGTNTVTLFLRRRKADPDEATHYRNRVRSWIENRELKPKEKKNALYGDLYLLEAYCKHINIAFTDYTLLWIGGAPNEAVQQSELWQEYSKAFDARTEVKNHQKKPVFKRQSEEAQQAELSAWLLRHVREIETEKLYYFLLAHSNAVPVLVIKSPADNKAMKKFLGYEWSAAKGSEGIKYLNAPVAQDADDDEPTLITAQLAAIQTPLYNPGQKDDTTKLNYYIRQNFLGQDLSLPESLRDFATTTRLENMLDFTRRDFNKAISLTPKKVVDIVSKWEIKRLNQIADISRGASPRPISSFLTDSEDGISWIKIGDVKFGEKYVTQTEEKITKEGAALSRKVSPGDFIVSNSMSVGRPFILKINGCIHDGWLLLSNIKSEVDKEFLYEMLCSADIQEQIQSIALGGIVENLNTSRASDLKLPIPPIDIQQSIVLECSEVENVIQEANKNIRKAKSNVENVIIELAKGTYKQISLNHITVINPSKSEIKDLDNDMLVSFVEMASVSNDGYIEYKEDRPLKSLRKGSYTYFAEGDVIVAKITPCMENGKCALAKNLTNGVGLGSSEFHVFRASEQILPAYLFYHLNRQTIREEAEKNMTGSSGHRRVPISFYENLKIPVPSLIEQQRVVDEIQLLEAQIATAQNMIDNAPAQKRAILKKWLE